MLKIIQKLFHCIFVIFYESLEGPHLKNEKIFFSCYNEKIISLLRENYLVITRKLSRSYDIVSRYNELSSIFKSKIINYLVITR